MFPNIAFVDSNLLEQMNNGGMFNSKLAREYDLSWQLIQSGYVTNVKTYSSFESLPIVDEYIFIKRNFSKLWVLYVFFIRIFSFKNPVRELQGLLKTRKAERIVYKSQIVEYKDYANFRSELIKANPLISVIIPTLDRYEYLKDVLRDLENQSYKNIEVIIVDQTEDFNKDFYQGWSLDLKFWYQKEKALWKARNEAIRASKGEYILLYDDDSLVDKDWIFHHLKTLDFFKADISSGVSLSTVGDKIPENYSYLKISEQLDTGNVLLKKDVFRKIGLFDRQFEKQRMGDGEFGLRAFINGYKNISNPYAKRVHLKANKGGLRQMGAWDAFRTQKWLDPKPIPSVLYLYRKYFGKKHTLYMLLKTIPFSILPYKYKGKKIINLLVTMLSMFFVPILLIQVNKSWKRSSKMLTEGEKIDQL
ncbi:glycosyltransferase family 2 protein [Wenyingzhuangia sp. IMCC45533]